jgi:hypothetical protein
MFPVFRKDKKICDKCGNFFVIFPKNFGKKISSVFKLIYKKGGLELQEF